MKKLKLIPLFILLLAASSLPAQQAPWGFDGVHSKISFNVTHLVISEVTGYFGKFSGQVTSYSDDFANSKIDFEVDVKSISTDNETRDNHLRSADFFDSEKYPKITFKSKSFTKVDAKNYKLTGDFTIKDITKTITLDVVFGGTIQDPWGNTRAGFKIKGNIDRFDYNLKWNQVLEAGGAVVGKNVELVCFVELVKNK